MYVLTIYNCVSDVYQKVTVICITIFRLRCIPSYVQLLIVAHPHISTTSCTSSCTYIAIVIILSRKVIPFKTYKVHHCTDTKALCKSYGT